MVAKIPLPEDDSIDLLKRILGERVKYRAFYTNIEADLIAQYELYIDSKGCPSQLSPLHLEKYVASADEAKKRKESLKGLYSPDKEKLPYEQLDKMRNKNGLAACPVCGEPGRPRTLDHCLPKTVFPEFSVNVLNLVPACDWCQGEKSVDYKTLDGSRSFIHPYFDDVNRPLFSIVFLEPFITPKISIKVKHDLPENLQRLVATHLNGIGFLERFNEIFDVSYQSIKRMAMRARVPGNLTLVQSLEEALLVATDKAINSWDAVLYRSVLENEELLVFLETQYSSEYP